MAQVPDIQSPQQVAGAANQPSLNVSVNPAAFGGPLAKGISDVGQVFQEHAQTLQGLKNKSDADTANTNATIEIDKVRSDFATAPMRQDAQTAADAVAKQIAEIRNKHRGDLDNPMAQSIYDQDSRRLQAFAVGDVYSNAARQQKVYNKTSNAAAADAAALPLAGLFAKGDDKSVQGIIDALTVKGRTDAALDGISDPAAADFQVKAFIGPRIKSALDQQRMDDPNGAMENFKKYSQYMTPTQSASAFAEIHQAQIPYNVDKLVQDAVNQVTAPTGSGSSAGFSDKVTGYEDRGGKPDAKNPRSTATGVGQFTEETWLDQMKRHPELTEGKTHQQILDMRKDPAVSRQMTNEYAQVNTDRLTEHGIPVNDGTLGMAHNLGAGGVAKIWKASDTTLMSTALHDEKATKANPEFAHETVGQYKAKMFAHYGTNGSSASDALTNIRGNYSSILTYVDGKIDEAGWGPVAKQMAEAKLRTVIDARTVSAQANIWASQNNLLKTLNGGEDGSAAKPTSLAELYKSYPGALADYRNLDGEHQKQINNMLLKNGHPELRDLDDAHLQSWQELDGMAKSDRTRFANLSLFDDARFAGLPANIKAQLFQQQDKIRGELSSGKPGEQATNHALAMAKPLLKGSPYEFTADGDNKPYYQFASKLTDNVQTWMRLNPGKVLPDENVQKWVSRIMFDMQNSRNDHGTIVQGVPNAYVEDLLGRIRTGGYPMPTNQQIQLGYAAKVKNGGR